MTAPIFNVYIEAHEWQCEPANDAAKACAEGGVYPSGPMLPIADNSVEAATFPLTTDAAEALLRMADAAGPAWEPKILTDKLRAFVGAHSASGPRPKD